MTKKIIVDGQEMGVRDYLDVENLRSIELRPFAGAAISMIDQTQPNWEDKCAQLMVDMTSIVQDTWEGNLQHAEHMLIAQASALQAVFFNMTSLCRQNLRNAEAMERFLRLGLKAQNQCRATLQTLVLLKNPTAVYAHQANIAHGHQQINNSPSPVASNQRVGRAGKRKKTAPHENELLEAPDGQRMDAREETPASSADPAMAAVGAVQRPTKRRGKGGISAKREQGPAHPAGQRTPPPDAGSGD